MSGRREGGTPYGRSAFKGHPLMRPREHKSRISFPEFPPGIFQPRPLAAKFKHTEGERKEEKRGEEEEHNEEEGSHAQAQTRW